MLQGGNFRVVSAVKDTLKEDVTPIWDERLPAVEGSCLPPPAPGRRTFLCVAVEAEDPLGQGLSGGRKPLLPLFQ